MYGQWRGDMLRAAEHCRRGTEDLEEGRCLPRSSGWREAVRKMRAIPAAGRLQDGRGSNQPGGFVSDIRAGSAIISQTRLWNKSIPKSRSDLQLGGQSIGGAGTAAFGKFWHVRVS